MKQRIITYYVASLVVLFIAGHTAAHTSKELAQNSNKTGQTLATLHNR